MTHPHTSPASPVRGFTLIELAVVMAIAGLMLAAAMPDVSAWLRNTRIRNQAEAMQTGLQRARTEAVRRNTPVTFWLVELNDDSVMDDQCALSDTGTSWVVSLDDPSGACGAAASSTSAPRLIAAHSAGDGGGGIAIVATLPDGSTAAQSVTFDAFGRVGNVASDIQRLDISYPSGSTASTDRALRVELTPAGQVRMCDPAVTASDDPRLCAF
ncbi:GspH/FimT family pseudopilin [Aquabacterium sp.]|jgi:type IV fimbrial biogenesis protein FimT|uniref:GspH/FimT family pseudopilin n=1 Tax=Aquabacterium sp. TaxID=1872578 RepID=UPI0025C5ECAF|nr:GspH/FimT family pseudopilin [Aquabacterium sp.]